MSDTVIAGWVSKNISTEPEKYGCDKGGHTLVSDYLYEVHPEGGKLPVLIIQNIPSVYRERRKYLALHQEYDNRVEAQRFRKHFKEVEHKGQTHIIWGDDLLTVSQAKELSDQLFDHLEDLENDGS